MNEDEETEIETVAIVKFGRELSEAEKELFISYIETFGRATDVEFTVEEP